MMNRRKLFAGLAAMGAVSALPLEVFAQERHPLTEEELEQIRRLQKLRRGEDPEDMPKSGFKPENGPGSKKSANQKDDRKRQKTPPSETRENARPAKQRPAPQKGPPQKAPDAATIEMKLKRAPSRTIRREERIERRDFQREFIRRRDIRVSLPSIDIQAINFDFGSSRIPASEYWKVEEIAIALRRFLRRNRDELFVIEGHTDAVGSRYSNQILSERRAASLKRVLVNRFGISPYALETIGFGEDDLLIRTPYEEWRNRRVTLRRVTDFIR